MATPRSRFARKEGGLGAGSIEICRPLWALPRRYPGFATNFGRFFLAADERNRSPSSGAAQAGDPFLHSRKQYSPFAVPPKEFIGLQCCAPPNRYHLTPWKEVF